MLKKDKSAGVWPAAPTLSRYVPQTSKVDLGEITHSGFEVLNKDKKKKARKTALEHWFAL